ncbi:hypothetical protein [Paenibacillus senegalimassiliensis]|uniref:hypothetical protein n=1 Tax=Paenibacillus senegalimassiliensis TaxID=1737426 RepID=UPI00073EC7A1|nr:hypothetical protein [Paenibacillus senegalimassiliensis]
MAKTDWTLTDTVRPEDINDIGHEINELHTEIKERLDTANRSPVTLQPGLQVIHAKRDGLFKLEQIEGKTEINGQGRTGIIGVENPYVINTSGNLLPPFYEWISDFGSDATYNVHEAYEIEINRKAMNRYGHCSYTISIQENHSYCLSAQVNCNVSGEGRAYIQYTCYDSSGASFGSSTHKIDAITEGFYFSTPIFTPEGAVSIRVSVGIESSATGTAHYINPMLTIGTEPELFVPQRKSMLAFETELHANPTDGNEPDILFIHNGEYKKLAKWRKVNIDNSMVSFAVPRNSEVLPPLGCKFVYIVPPPLAEGSKTESPLYALMTSYSGDVLRNVTMSSNFSDINQFLINFNYQNKIQIVVSNTDSGWGDEYTPTQNEVRAFFNGWRMRDAVSLDPYNGAGTKAWGTVISGGADLYTTTLPTTQAPNWKPYNLLYRLAKETIEPVAAEGELLLTEGDNTVEVGTGITLRERAKPIKSGNTLIYHYINRTSFPESLLKNTTSEILNVYANNNNQTGLWTHVYDDTANGLARVTYGNVTQEFDESSAYSVTYIKLDKSPTQPITGYLVTNEKAQISELAAGVAEALQRVSVVEQKKVEKDKPRWVDIIMLNSWTTNAVEPLQYRVVDNHLELRGTANAGVTTAGTILCELPEKAWPKRLERTQAITWSYAADATACLVQISSNGQLSVATTPKNFINIRASIPLD